MSSKVPMWRTMRTEFDIHYYLVPSIVLSNDMRSLLVNISWLDVQRHKASIKLPFICHCDVYNDPAVRNVQAIKDEF